MTFIVYRTELLCAQEEQVLQHSFVTHNVCQIMTEKQINHWQF